MRNAASWAVLALVSFGLGACAPDGPYCDGAAAEAALQAADSGDTVELGACEVSGPLHVPPGVTLQGVDGAVIVAPEGSGGVMLLGGTGDVTTLAGVTVRVDGVIGVLARGGGRVALRGVTVEAPRGLGVGASGLDALEMSAVVVRGPIDASNADDVAWLEVQAAPGPAGECPPPGPCECAPGETQGDEVCSAEGEWVTWAATHGLFLQDVVADLDDVTVTGFAEHGVVAVSSEVSWAVGGVFDTLGVGLRASGGTLDLSDVRVERTHQGVRGVPPYGVLADGVGLSVRGLVACDNDRYGVFLRDVTGTLEDATLEGNGDAALWVADSAGLSVMRATVGDNAFGGLVMTGSSNVAIQASVIDATRASERPVGALGVLRVGDGLHVTDSYAAIVLEDVTLLNNERAGAIVDLGAALDADIAFRDVEVSGSGAQLGAVAGSGTGGTLTASSPAGWDDGIARLGAALANDAAFSGDLAAVTGESPVTRPVTDVLSVVAPMF